MQSIRQRYSEVLSHCCQVRHYSFTILRVLFVSLCEWQGTHTWSCSQPLWRRIWNTNYRSQALYLEVSIPFSPSIHIQHVNWYHDSMRRVSNVEASNNVEASKYKLKSERTILNQALENFSLSDLELGEERLDREHVFVRGVSLWEVLDALEKLYYSVGTYELTHSNCHFCGFRCGY